MLLDSNCTASVPLTMITSNRPNSVFGHSRFSQAQARHLGT